MLRSLTGGQVCAADIHVLHEPSSKRAAPCIWFKEVWNVHVKVSESFIQSDINPSVQCTECPTSYHDCVSPVLSVGSCESNETRDFNRSHCKKHGFTATVLLPYPCKTDLVF